MYDVSWCCWLVRKRQYSTSVFLQTWMDSQEFCGFVCVCGYTTRSLYTLVNIHSSERQHDLWLESVQELQYPLHSSHNDCVSNPKPWVKQYSFHTPYMTSKPATRMQAMNQLLKLFLNPEQKFHLKFTASTVTPLDCQLPLCRTETNNKHQSLEYKEPLT